MTHLARRRFLGIAAAAALMPRGAGAASVATWRGTALGAAAEMRITGLDGREAGPIFDRVRAEIDRLEDIFSLYRPASALARLNAAGALAAPPHELLEVLSLATGIHAATGGAFDPSVQPLWQVYARSHGRPEEGAVEEARALTGWPGVTFDATAIRFRRSGMGLTLNGIAQGYVADRVTALLRREGLRDILVDTGEIRASGNRPGGGAWRAGIVAPGGHAPVARVGLSDRALATSAPRGTLIGASGSGHILDPRTGRPGGAWRLVAVSAGRAALADGLSTAFCIMDRNAVAAALAVFADARVEHLDSGRDL